MGGGADGVVTVLLRRAPDSTLSTRGKVGGGEAELEAEAEAEAEVEANVLNNGVPHGLHVYAQPALAIYVQLVHERGELLALMQELRAREVAPHAEVADLDLPQLHWDTSVLDMEEDRVIWVRESELGKDAPDAP